MSSPLGTTLRERIKRLGYQDEPETDPLSCASFLLSLASGEEPTPPSLLQPKLQAWGLSLQSLSSPPPPCPTPYSDDEGETVFGSCWDALVAYAEAGKKVTEEGEERISEIHDAFLYQLGLHSAELFNPNPDLSDLSDLSVGAPDRSGKEMTGADLPPEIKRLLEVDGCSDADIQAVVEVLERVEARMDAFLEARDSVFGPWLTPESQVEPPMSGLGSAARDTLASLEPVRKFIESAETILSTERMFRRHIPARLAPMVKDPLLDPSAIARLESMAKILDSGS